MSQAPRYWAFISYSHADSAVAARVHKALEAYSLPSHLCRAHDLPRRLIPIFRDVEELEASSGLTHRLQEALDDSRWLIVLCSRSAAKSKYVNEEIDYFIQRHSARRVLCALVDGEPPDCFPPALCALPDEPLAADFRSGHDPELAKLKLIAAMAVVGFTELRNREAQRRQRNQLLAAAGLGVASLSTALYWDFYQREHVDYYNSYIRQHGIWQGLDRISASTASRRSYSYRFTRHGRLHPPERVEIVNGQGYCPNLFYQYEETGDNLLNIAGMGYDSHQDYLASGRFCSATFRYDGAGAIQEETLHNLVGVPQQSLVYTGPNLAQFTLQGFAGAYGYGGIRYVQFSRSAQGHDRELRFFYDRDLPRANVEHAFGYRYEHDDEGRIVLREPLGPDGESTGAQEHYRYGSTGLLLEEKLTDTHQRPRLGFWGWARREREYTPEGNLARSRVFDEAGQPALDLRGVHSRRYVYNPKGNQTEVCYEDVQGQLTTKMDRTHGLYIEQRQFYASCLRYDYEQRGWMTRLALFDAQGQPMNALSGEAVRTYAYDERGNDTEDATYDRDGKLTGQWGDPPLKLRYYSDESGRLIRDEAVDEQGVIQDASVYHYDSIGRQIRTDSLDASGNLRIYERWGHAALQWEHDERGNVTRTSALDENLKLTAAGRDGYAVLQEIWDDQGNVAEVRFLDENNRLMRRRVGDAYAMERRRHDRLGRVVEKTFYDEHEKPMRSEQGYFGVRIQYDARGREAVLRYLDAEGQEALMPGLGHAGVRYAYDAQDNRTETIYLGLDGQPVQQGVARETRQYNRYGQHLETRYLDALGQAAPSNLSGCHAEIFHYHADTRLDEQKCLDATGQLRNRKNGGWARMKLRRDAQGFSEEYFDAAGKPVKSYS